MNMMRFLNGLSKSFLLKVVWLCGTAFIASMCYADYNIDGLSVDYTANADAQYVIDSDSENSREIKQGDVIRFTIDQALSVRGEGFKESFMPASQVPNLNRLLGFSLPPSVQGQTLYYQYFNGASGVPVCRALVVDPGVAPATAVPVAMKRLIKSLQSNSVDYQLASGYLLINCQSR
jgi:ABC-type amino acid transport substrate-binding protein